LSVLDEHAAEVWARDSATFTARQRCCRHDLANWRLIRYADDFVLVVSGTRAQTGTLREEVAAVLAQVGLRLSEQKTRIAHIDEGFDFLGGRIQRQQKRGAVKRVVHTYRPRRP
jgi:RNA-directed DNA polymerase